MKKIILIISFIVLGLFNQHAIADVVYVHNDALGSPIMESDANGAIIPGSHSHYKPFGETLEASKDDVGYTGHLNDSDLGLTYMQARYYDPVIGRFYSNDPIGFRDIHSFNRYAYANNNPYKYTDPTGMSSVKGACGNRPGKCYDSGGDKNDGVPAKWGEIPKDENGDPSNGSITCDSNCQYYATNLSLQIDQMKINMHYRQTQGVLIVGTLMATPAAIEGLGIAGLLAKENTAAALLATSLFSSVSGDLATITALALRKEIPHIMQSLLKVGRFGKPKTKPLLPLKPNEIIIP